MLNEIELTTTYGSPINIVGSFIHKPSGYIHEFTKEERDELEQHIIDKIHELDLNELNLVFHSNRQDYLGAMRVSYCFNAKARKTYGSTKNKFTVAVGIQEFCTTIDTGLNQHYQEWVLQGEVGHYEQRVKKVSYAVTQTCNEITQARKDSTPSLHSADAAKKHKSCMLQKAKDQISKNLNEIKQEEWKRSKLPLFHRLYLAIS